MKEMIIRSTENGLDVNRLQQLRKTDASEETIKKPNDIYSLPICQQSLNITSSLNYQSEENLRKLSLVSDPSYKFSI